MLGVCQQQPWSRSGSALLAAIWPPPSTWAAISSHLLEQKVRLTFENFQDSEALHEGRPETREMRGRQSQSPEVGEMKAPGRAWAGFPEQPLMAFQGGHPDRAACTKPAALQCTLLWGPHL